MNLHCFHSIKNSLYVQKLDETFVARKNPFFWRKKSWTTFYYFFSIFYSSLFIFQKYHLFETIQKLLKWNFHEFINIYQISPFFTSPTALDSPNIIQSIHNLSTLTFHLSVSLCYFASFAGEKCGGGMYLGLALIHY